MIIGINIHPFTQYPYNSMSYGKQIKLLKEAGFKSLRFEVKHGTTPSAIQSFVEEAKDYGMDILPTLLPNIDLATENDLQVIYNTSKQQAKELAESCHAWEYELHNELDNFCILQNGDSAVDANGNPYTYTYDSPAGLHWYDYQPDRLAKAVACLKGMYDGVKASSSMLPTCIINAAGHGHWGFFEALQRENVQWDVTGWHWYDDSGDLDETVPIDDAGDGGQVYNPIQILKGHDKPIYITEINHRGGTQVDSSLVMFEALKRQAKICLNNGIESYHVYEAFDESLLYGMEAHYGVFETLNVDSAPLLLPKNGMADWKEFIKNL